METTAKITRGQLNDIRDHAANIMEMVGYLRQLTMHLESNDPDVQALLGHMDGEVEKLATSIRECGKMSPVAGSIVAGAKHE